jgi:hydroxypyruvate isomerase
MKRRTFVQAGIATLATGAVGASLAHSSSQSSPARSGRLKQSVCRWCFGGMPLDALCKAAKEMGLASVELLGPDEWPIAAANGLTCAVATNVAANPIGKGFNRPENHDAIIEQLTDRLPLVQAAGIPNQIVFSGNRAGLSDAAGLEACVQGLTRITPLAEKLGVTLIMELLNSKIDHKDYMCDRTPWGAELVKRVDSPRFKLLYDIYHMQIMEGDVIRTLTDNISSIGHFHTAGVPGRNEIDSTQELNYPAICRAILKAGYTGYLGQEFMPAAKDPLASLRAAVQLCDV